VTADGELPDQVTLEALEEFVGQCLEKLLRTPYLLRDDARELLEEIAYRRVRSTAATMVELASRRFTWTPELGEAERREIVADLIGGSGIAVAVDGDFRFTSPAVQDYLAACHIVRRRRWWRPWNHLVPQATWPWRDAGVELYVAGLWWRDAKPAVERKLKRLVHDRHRDPNIGFVIELIRRDLVPGSEIRDHVVALLHRELSDGRMAEGRWVTTVGWLHLLDAATAVAQLETIVGNPGPSMTSRRRFVAVVELARYDPAREAKNLWTLANTLTGTPEDRFETAKLIGDRDREPGVRAMTLLANTPDMRELRVDAAIHTGSSPLVSELILHDRTLHDDARLRLSAALLEVDPGGAIEVLEQFAEASRLAGTPLRIAEMLRSRAPEEAWRIATGVAWPVRGEVDGWVRLRAVRLLGEFDRAQAIPLLRRLSEEQAVPGEVRVHAATLVVTDYGGTTAALIELVRDPGLDLTDCADAAEVVGRFESAAGAHLFLFLAEARTSVDSSRLSLLRRAHKLDPGQAVEVLAEFAKTTQAPGKQRIEAADIAHSTLGTRRTIELYSAIVADADDATAMAAARKAKLRDKDAGERLLGRVASRNGADSGFRLTAAKEAGGYGKQALTDLAETARPDSDRLTAAKALYGLDRPGGKAALGKLVQKSGDGKVRLDAALALPGSDTVDALILISQDRHEDDDIRVEAAVKAMKEDKKRGRKALTELAEARGIAQRTREKIRRLLDK